VASVSVRDPGRRDRILDAALDSFSEHGFAGSTIEDVRLRSGASVGSIYHHFGGKEGLAAALYVDGLAGYQRGLLRALRDNDGAEAGIKAVVRHHLRWVQSHRKLAGFLFEHREPEVRMASQGPLRELNRDLFAELDEWLGRHIAAGAIEDLSRDAFYAVVIGPAQEVSRHWLAGRTEAGLGRLETELADAAWKAIRKDKS
jgi:AcrR family transcriptional regulator